MMTRREALRKMVETPGAAGLMAAGIVVPVAGIECGQDLGDLKDRISALRQMKDIACVPGTVDYDPYFQGMANGLIVALAIMDDDEPRFVGAPKEWGHELRSTRLASEKWGREGEGRIDVEENGQ